MPNATNLPFAAMSGSHVTPDWDPEPVAIPFAIGSLVNDCRSQIKLVVQDWKLPDAKKSAENATYLPSSEMLGSCAYTKPFVVVVDRARVIPAVTSRTKTRAMAG